MGRIRTIKPEMYESLSAKKLPFMARYVFCGLISMADDEGRLSYTPLKARAHIFTSDSDVTDEMIVGWIEDLAASESIVKYTVGGRDYIAFPRWKAHQVINRPTPSKLPAPPLTEDSLINHGGLTEDSLINHGGLTEDSLINHGGLTEDSLPEQGTGNREQGTGSAKSRTASKPKPSLEEFSVTEELQAWVKSKAPNASRAWVDHETEKFIGYYLESPKKLRSVTQAWRNWMLKAVDFNPPVKESEVSPFTYPNLPPEVPRFLPSGLNAKFSNYETGDGSQ